MATVQTKSAQSTGTSVSVAITTTAGNLLGIVTGGFSGVGAATGAPSRTGETNNNAIADFGDASGDHLRGDYMMAIGGNSNAVTGNGTGSTGGTSCCVTEFSGRKTTAALGAVNHATSATTTVQPGSITPTASSDLMTGTGDNGSGTAASTIDSAFTVQEAGGTGTVWDATNAIAGTANKDNVTAVAVNPTWTTGHAGTTAMAALIMEFLAAAASGPPFLPQYEDFRRRAYQRLEPAIAAFYASPDLAALVTPTAAPPLATSQNDPLWQRKRWTHSPEGYNTLPQLTAAVATMPVLPSQDPPVRVARRPGDLDAQPTVALNAVATPAPLPATDAPVVRVLRRGGDPDTQPLTIQQSVATPVSLPATDPPAMPTRRIIEPTSPNLVGPGALQSLTPAPFTSANDPNPVPARQWRHGDFLNGAPFTPATVIVAVMRRTLSLLGARVGSRQNQSGTGG